MAKLTVDPATRIEGHLRVDVEIENGKVKDAWAAATLYRGFESILKGRDPRDAWLITQRICGVCPEPHATAAVLASEAASGIDAPDAGRIIRNLMLAANFVHSHILHFYHLNALDYVDVTSALQADPVKARSLAGDAGTKLSDFAGVKAKLKSFVDSGQLGPFANGYWGHPAYKLPPELNLIAVAHYLEALDMQAKAANAIGIFGGKQPHQQTMVAGGVTVRPTVQQLLDFKYRMMEVQKWVDAAYLPDVLAVAPFYLEDTTYGIGYGNLHSWGVFPVEGGGDSAKKLLPRGDIFAGKIAEVKESKPEYVTEDVNASWYDGDSGLNPEKGTTNPAYSGYKPLEKYSWDKAPRINGTPMEVGPLARMAVAYGKGDPAAKKLIDSTLAKLGIAGKPEVLVSVLGRLAARALETKLLADATVTWADELIDLYKKGRFETYKPHDVPGDSKGIGMTEAPRGSLAHWVDTKGGKVDSYQIVAATTWNGSPRDAKGQRGPLEEALVGTPVADPAKPVEIMRVVHSFDP